MSESKYGITTDKSPAIRKFRPTFCGPTINDIEQLGSGWMSRRSFSYTVAYPVHIQPTHLVVWTAAFYCLQDGFDIYKIISVDFD